ncbi:hypothetical protein CRUP_032733 [Coryphaenoides rupestris]|nr:hypothetical protein CRUP_032733 [Coryphaenoides rupestris]
MQKRIGLGLWPKERSTMETVVAMWRASHQRAPHLPRRNILQRISRRQRNTWLGSVKWSLALALQVTLAPPLSLPVRPLPLLPLS